MLTLSDEAVILVAIGSLLLLLLLLWLLLLLQQSCIHCIVRNLLRYGLVHQRPSSEIPTAANDSFEVLSESRMQNCHSISLPRSER